MAMDVSEATFNTDVIERSRSQVVIVDVWAPWCGPCTTLTPILEKVVGETGGKVVLAKVNAAENPNLTQALRVQGIPAVFAAVDGQLMRVFEGAQPEHVVRQVIESLLPTSDDEAIAALLANGDEQSLLAVLDIEPGNEQAIVLLADMLTARGEGEQALQLLARIPESDAVRRAAAAARLSMRPPDDYDHQLESLLPRVKGDDEARQQFVDILELMGADDPRTAAWRKKLTAHLF